MIKKESRILIIDDFEMVRVSLVQSLRKLGFNSVDQAVDGKNALDMMEEAYNERKPFGLVFSDLNMPKLSGLDLLVACRHDARFKTVPFVMISSESERQYVILSLQQGANDYIIKPFSIEVIQNKINKICEKLNKQANQAA